jgi:Tetracyclin repressor-like, C-terminal domain
VRDVAITFANDWAELLEAAARDAQLEGAFDGSEDPAQLAFELDAYLLLANAQFVVSGGPGPLDRARVAIDTRLAAAAPPA